jgi:hypothetical protein
MIRLSAMLFFVCTLKASNPKENERLPEIGKNFPLLWKADIGRVSFRSNVIFNGKDVIIGSNGSYYMDYNLYDKKSGVYILNGQNGKIKKSFSGNCLGDMDVNGILLYNQKLYFGNDNEEFFCTTPDGKTIWKKPTSGDIEHEPVLIEGKDKKYIVYASEDGEVRAVEPETGNTVWTYYTPNFNGWKPEDNRSIFKVKSYFSNTLSFYTKPVLRDLNHDGVLDLLYLTYDSKLYAINGANGQLLWCYSNDENFQIQNIVTGTASDPTPIIFHYTYKGPNKYVAYQTTLNAKGKCIKIDSTNETVSGLSLNNFCTKNNELILADRESLLVYEKNQLKTTISRSFQGVNKYSYSSINEPMSRNYGDALLSNTTFQYKGSKNCIMVLNQHDYANFDYGFIEIISLDTKQVIERFELPASSEMAPILKDVNQDGYLDLLVNCTDGYLYCYNLKIRNIF